VGGARGRGPQCGRFVKRSGYLEAIGRGDKISNAVGHLTAGYGGMGGGYVRVFNLVGSSVSNRRRAGEPLLA